MVAILALLLALLTAAPLHTLAQDDTPAEASEPELDASVALDAEAAPGDDAAPMEAERAAAPTEPSALAEAPPPPAEESPHVEPPEHVAPPPPVAEPTARAAVLAASPAEDLTVRDPEGVPAPPPAPPLPLAARWSPIYTGSFVTRYELRKGYDDIGISRGRFLEGDAFFYRTRFGFNTGSFDVGNDLKVAAQITPQAAGNFGERGPNTIVDAQLGLHEGYARVQGKRVRIDAGRYEMVYGDALMIGTNDWNNVGRTFDGVRARIGNESWLDLFANVIDEGRPSLLGTGKGDYYFLGAYASLGPAVREALGTEAIADLDLYLLARVWGDEDDVQPVGYRLEGGREFTLGARAKGRLGAYDYRAETGLQTGTRPGAIPTTAVDVDSVRALAWQGDVEVGLTLLDEQLRIALEALYATGAKPGDTKRTHGWEDLFPSGHKWLGLADAFNQNGEKRTNVGSVVFHLTSNPIAPLTFQFDAHMFARPQPTVVGGSAGLAGGELDLGAAYMLARGLRVRALYGAFLPNANLYADNVPVTTMQRNPDAAQYFEAELRYDF